jgi:hypothetical protein
LSEKPVREGKGIAIFLDFRELRGGRKLLLRRVYELVPNGLIWVKSPHSETLLAQ